MGELRQIEDKETLTPARAAKIWGKLGYAQPLIFGRVGRSILAPFTQRQYSPFPSRFRPLSDDSAEVLQGWVGALTYSAPSRILFCPPGPTLIYVDACGEGQVGAAALRDNAERFAHTHLAGRLTKIAGIYEFELPGDISRLLIAAILTPGEPLLLRVANSAAVATIARGNGATTRGRALAAVFCAVAAF